MIQEALKLVESLNEELAYPENWNENYEEKLIKKGKRK